MRRPATSSLLYVLGFVAALASLALVSSGAQAQEVTPASNATIHLLAIDADPTGNTATSLGPVDPCVRVEMGAQVAVDLVVDAIPPDRPIMAFQLSVNYDPAVLEVTSYDQHLLLGAVGQFQPFDAFNDPTPDTDGTLDLGVLDIASNNPDGANVESGPGVIARITFLAKAPGQSSVSIAFSPPGTYPMIIDMWNNVIEVNNLGSAVIAVGSDCPVSGPDANVTPLPGIAEIFGTPTPSPSDGTTSPARSTQGPLASPGKSTLTTGAGAVAPAPTPVAPMAGLGASLDASGSNITLAVLGTVLGSLGAASAGAGLLLTYMRRRSVAKGAPQSRPLA